MIDPTRYSITVRCVDIDGELIWRASVTELPDFAEYGEDAHSAYDAALEAIRDLYAAAQADGLPFPDPATDVEEYSGRITLRMPPSLHAKASGFADREATSLNQYLCLVLSSTIGAASEPAEVWGKSAAWVAGANVAWQGAVKGQASITGIAVGGGNVSFGVVERARTHAAFSFVNTTSGALGYDFGMIPEVIPSIGPHVSGRARRRATE